MFDYTAIVDQLQTVSRSNDNHSTGIQMTFEVEFFLYALIFKHPTMTNTWLKIILLSLKWDH